MADEEGCAELNLQLKQRQPGCPSGAGAQSSPWHLPWITVALWVAGAGVFLILLRAVMGLSAWVSQLQITSDGQNRGALLDFQSHLKQTLCEPHHGNSSEGSRCKLCPKDWQLNGDKCYWLSKERKNWTRSHDNCSRKRSRMLVIQTQEEMDFIQVVIRGEIHVWVGLRVTPPGGWTWVDGSPLDPAHFSVSSSTEGNSCARLKGSRIQAELCGAGLKWICQKEAAVI